MGNSAANVGAGSHELDVWMKCRDLYIEGERVGRP